MTLLARIRATLAGARALADQRMHALSRDGSRDPDKVSFFLAICWHRDTAKTVLAQTTPLTDLQLATRRLDWTLPPEGPVTQASVDGVRMVAAEIAAHAWRVADSVAARPRAQPMKPAPSAADALLTPPAEETDHVEARP